MGFFKAVDDLMFVGSVCYSVMEGFTRRAVFDLDYSPGDLRWCERRGWDDGVTGGTKFWLEDKDGRLLAVIYQSGLIPRAEEHVYDVRLSWGWCDPR